MSGRVQQHVLDHHALEMLKIRQGSARDCARPAVRPAARPTRHAIPPETREGVLTARERVRRAHRDACSVVSSGMSSRRPRRCGSRKFTRDRGVWRLGGVDQPLDLRQLLSNLGTYAIHETKGQRRTDGKHTLVVPLRQADFVHLVSLLYPHAAAEDAARALWRRFLGAEDLDARAGDACRAQRGDDRPPRPPPPQAGQTSLIFRDPDQNTAHEKALVGAAHAARARACPAGACRRDARHRPTLGVRRGSLRHSRRCADGDRHLAGCQGVCGRRPGDVRWPQAAPQGACVVCVG